MKQTTNIPENLIFILGCQRSGTTWLANLFDANPEVLLFMEPFSIPYDIFPEFPEPSYFLNQSSPDLDHFLQTELPARLMRYKALVSQKSLYDPSWFRWERKLLKAGYKRKRYLPGRLKKNLHGFQLLNLNRMDDNFPIYSKNRQPAIWAIKELRLAGKIPVLLSAFPQARFLVIIRHPAATVHSILSWFQRGRLGELHRELETYLEKIEVQSVAAPYKHLIAHCRQGNLSHKVALYWRISYETLCNQLSQQPKTCFLVYEQLASQPKATIEKTFIKLKIPWSTSVEQYLSHSTKKNADQTTAITTVRNSAAYYRSWIEEISEKTRQEVLEVVSDSFLIPQFKPFYATYAS